jgi:hypothetical protein
MTQTNELTNRERLTIAAALQWYLECIKSGQPYDMSHLKVGNDPLNDGEIEALRKRFARTRVNRKQYEGIAANLVLLGLDSAARERLDVFMAEFLEVEEGEEEDNE